MLILLRILFGVGLAYGLEKVRENAQVAPDTGDLTNAFYLAFCVILAVANAVVWAPYFGSRLSEPLTGAITRSTYVERKNCLLQLLRWLDNRRWRRLALCFCFLEGIRHPDWPTAFVIGLGNARPGSWLEVVFAREVFRFDNAQHCLRAFQALRRHGLDPRPHHNPEVNMVLISVDREVKPEPEKIAVPPAAEAAPLKRDQRIRLFEGAERPPAQAEIELSIPAAAGHAVGNQPEPAFESGPTDSRGSGGSKEAAGTLNLFGRIRAFLRGS